MTIDISWMEENILLQKLKNSDKAIIYKTFKVRRYQAGEMIVSQGTPGGELYILHSGQAVITHRHDNKSTFLGYATESAIFGERSFLSHEERAATVIAHSHCIVYELNRSGFGTLMVENYELLLSLLTHMVTYTSDVIKKMSQEQTGESKGGAV
ncbi:MAG: cyclic nucleotide-binding domain-containing protein [Mariprofundaceae bacterium]